MALTSFNGPTASTHDETIVCGVDLLPTLCTVAGAAPPSTPLDGHDVSRAFQGGPITQRPPLFWEYGRDDSYPIPWKKTDRSPNLAAREGNWKLLMNSDGSRIELDDLSKSPHEDDNVALLHPAIRDRLATKLLAWEDGLPGYPAVSRP